MDAAAVMAEDEGEAAEAQAAAEAAWAARALPSGLAHLVVDDESAEQATCKDVPALLASGLVPAAGRRPRHLPATPVAAGGAGCVHCDGVAPWRRGPAG